MFHCHLSPPMQPPSPKPPSPKGKPPPPRKLRCLGRRPCLHRGTGARLLDAAPERKRPAQPHPALCPVPFAGAPTPAEEGRPQEADSRLSALLTNSSQLVHSWLALAFSCPLLFAWCCAQRPPGPPPPLSAQSGCFFFFGGGGGSHSRWHPPSQCRMAIFKKSPLPAPMGSLLLLPVGGAALQGHTANYERCAARARALPSCARCPGGSGAAVLERVFIVSLLHFPVPSESRLESVQRSGRQV